MRITLTLLLAAGMCIAASAQTKNITYNIGIDKGQYVDGHKEGHWIHYFSDSSIRAEGNYKKDQKDGEWKEYYANGGIMSVVTYKDGLMNFGTSKEYFENGQLKDRRKYKDRELKGTVTTRFEDGNVEEKSEYKDGHLVGTSTRYWPNRKLRWEKEYNKNGNCIKAREYYQNGKLMRTADYDPTITGSELSYDEKGNLKKRVKLFNNKLVLEEKYYENGKLEKSTTYSPEKNVDFRLTKIYNTEGELKQIDTVKNARLVGKALYTDDRIEYYKYENNNYEGGFFSYYKNDKKHTIAEEGYYKKGYKAGLWKSYYPNAKLQFEGSYIYDTILKQGGLATGTHKYYFEDGSDQKVEYYELQKVKSAAYNTLVNKSLKTGTWITYNPNKSTGEKVNYANGLKNGPYELYDESGRLKLKRTYKDDHFVGIEEEYYDNGKLSHLITRDEHGYKNGTEKTFFLNGNLKEITNYGEGRQEGAYETYYENGKPRTKGFYEFAVKTAKWSTWLEDGSLFCETLYEPEEHKYTTTYYFGDGKLAASLTGSLYKKKITHAALYINGNATDVLEYYKIGKGNTDIESFEMKASNGKFKLSVSYQTGNDIIATFSAPFPLD